MARHIANKAAQRLFRKTIDIFVCRDKTQHCIRIKERRKWQLHQDAVYSWIIRQSGNHRFYFTLFCSCRQFHLH